MSATQFDTVQEYLDSFPDDVAAVLRQVQDRIRAAAPGADEVISYGIPTLRLEGRSLVHFAGWKKHVSLYPMPEADESLAAEMATYAAGKGTLRFPLGQPIPAGLLERIISALLESRSRA